MMITFENCDTLGADHEDMMHFNLLNNHSSKNPSAGESASFSGGALRKREKKGQEKAVNSFNNSLSMGMAMDDCGRNTRAVRNSNNIRKKEAGCGIKNDIDQQFQVPTATSNSRYRKNQAEMDVLYREFKKNKGKMPPRK